MKEISILKNLSQLKKMPVVLPDAGETVGEISDVIIHPTEGTVLGLMLQSIEGVTQAVAASDFFIFGRNNVVVVLENALSDQSGAREKMAGGISVCREAIGASIVTEKGKYIGDVSDIWIVDEPLRAVYQVIESHWQKYFGKGLFISVNLPYAWSRDGTRFIVREVELLSNRGSQPAEVIGPDGYEATLDEKAHRAER